MQRPESQSDPGAHGARGDGFDDCEHAHLAGLGRLDAAAPHPAASVPRRLVAGRFAELRTCDAPVKAGYRILLSLAKVHPGAHSKKRWQLGIVRAVLQQDGDHWTLALYMFPQRRTDLELLPRAEAVGSDKHRERLDRTDLLLQPPRRRLTRLEVGVVDPRLQSEFAQPLRNTLHFWLVGAVVAEEDIELARRRRPTLLSRRHGSS